MKGVAESEMSINKRWCWGNTENSWMVFMCPRLGGVLSMSVTVVAPVEHGLRGFGWIADVWGRGVEGFRRVSGQIRGCEVECR
jgi:hypothetical protein